MSNTNCYHCIYFHKRPGVGNYFIYKCIYWGITTQKILPQSVVISSIGEKCPFFKKKEQQKSNDNTKNKKNGDGFDIIV